MHVGGNDDEEDAAFEGHEARESASVETELSLENSAD
jgi:hypothetical protein